MFSQKPQHFTLNQSSPTASQPLYADMPPLSYLEKPKRHIISAPRTQTSSVPCPTSPVLRSQAHVEIPPLVVPEAWDGHFHIDHLKYLPDSLSQFQHLVPYDAAHEVKLTGGVIVFCNPSKFPPLSVIRHLSHLGFKIAVGIHPKHASQLSLTQFNDFRTLLLSPYVSALGEIGLDTTATPQSQGYQNQLLDRLLPLLSQGKRLTLVLHCRPFLDSYSPDTRLPKTDFLIQSLLDRLRLNNIPQSQKIHFHCFTGSPHMAQIWLRYYPKTVFGFTHSFPTSFPETFNSLKNHQFALETDAPHFRFGTRYGGVTGPGQIGMVAGRLSAVSHIDWRQLLINSSRNLSNLYS